MPIRLAQVQPVAGGFDAVDIVRLPGGVRHGEQNIDEWLGGEARHGGGANMPEGVVEAFQGAGEFGLFLGVPRRPSGIVVSQMDCRIDRAGVQLDDHRGVIGRIQGHMRLISWARRTVTLDAMDGAAQMDS